MELYNDNGANDGISKGRQVDKTTKYEDFLNLSFQEIRNKVKIPESQRAGPRGGVKDPFPTVLYRLLEEVEQYGLANIISWLPHGRSFVIHSPELFEKIFIKNYFNHTKFASFQRQLNLYGFKRVAWGGTGGRAGLYHPLLIRGRPELLKLMYRKQAKRAPHYSQTVLSSSSSTPKEQKEHRDVDKKDEGIIDPPIFSSRSSNDLLTIQQLPVCGTMMDSAQQSHAPNADHREDNKKEVVTMKNKSTADIFASLSKLKLHAQANGYKNQLLGGFEPISFTQGVDASILNLMYNQKNKILSFRHPSSNYMPGTELNDEIMQGFNNDDFNEKGKGPSTPYPCTTSNTSIQPMVMDQKISMVDSPTAAVNCIPSKGNQPTTTINTISSMLLQQLKSQQRPGKKQDEGGRLIAQHSDIMTSFAHERHQQRLSLTKKPKNNNTEINDEFWDEIDFDFVDINPF